MLRVEFQDIANAIVIRMEGLFTGGFAVNAGDFVARCRIPSRIVIDLSEVSLIDFTGEEVLCRLSRLGVNFVADTPYAQGVCERLKLPLLRKRGWTCRYKV